MKAPSVRVPHDVVDLVSESDTEEDPLLDISRGAPLQSVPQRAPPQSAPETTDTIFPNAPNAPNAPNVPIEAFPDLTTMRKWYAQMYHANDFWHIYYLMYHCIVSHCTLDHTLYTLLPEDLKKNYSLVITYMTEAIAEDVPQVIYHLLPVEEQRKCLLKYVYVPILTP